MLKEVDDLIDDPEVKPGETDLLIPISQLTVAGIRNRELTTKLIQRYKRSYHGSGMLAPLTALGNTHEETLKPRILR